MAHGPLIKLSDFCPEVEKKIFEELYKFYTHESSNSLKVMNSGMLIKRVLSQ